MKPLFFVIFFCLITSLNSTTHAQNDFAKLERNVNVRAKGLLQKLNITKDTLILQSKSLIQKVYSVNYQNVREVDVNVGANAIKIPLTKLSKGKHVFVAVQQSLRIVFVVRLFEEDDILLAMNDQALVPKN
nr:hypothetical protein [uncultured Psychroserpens sp.]